MSNDERIEVGKAAGINSWPALIGYFFKTFGLSAGVTAIFVVALGLGMHFLWEDRKSTYERHYTAQENQIESLKLSSREMVEVVRMNAVAFEKSAITTAELSRAVEGLRSELRSQSYASPYQPRDNRYPSSPRPSGE